MSLKTQMLAYAEENGLDALEELMDEVREEWNESDDGEEPEEGLDDDDDFDDE